MTHRHLDPAKVVETIDRLLARIEDRFPGSGLAEVCNELGLLARETQRRAQALARPYWWMRLAWVLVALLSLIGSYFVVLSIGLKIEKVGLLGALQGIDSAFNVAALAGGTAWFLMSAESRRKRQLALDWLGQIRSIAHVIDMHQLTKDPGMLVYPTLRTPASPNRTLTAFELKRYLDYCSEMLSLTAKLAAIMHDSVSDVQLTDAVSDVEQLCTNLSQEIWQKITLVERLQPSQ